MIIYNLLRLIAYIIILILSIFSKKIRSFFGKRFFVKGFNKKIEKKILIHMSSVGEFNLSVELINKLLEQNNKIILSIMTDTGFKSANDKYYKNENVEIIYFPLDDYLLLKKIFKNNEIIKTIIIETEIWPNLYRLASKYSELFIVNGRLTEKRLTSYLKIKQIIKKTINYSKLIMVQSEEDKLRYEKLGVEGSKIEVYKNLKYSIKYEKLDEIKKLEYKKNIIEENKKIIVCGSTRPGEEKIWLNVFNKLNKNNNYQLILVPRHLDRIEEITNEIEKIFNNKNYSLLSENKKNDIIIVDKMGVLRDFYQLADFVFVGGTLVDIGGHSILEPLYYGKVPIIGEYYQNIEEIVNEAKKLNFIKIVKNEKEIIEYLQNEKIINTEMFFEKNNEINKIIKKLIEN